MPPEVLQRADCVIQQVGWAPALWKRSAAKRDTTTDCNSAGPSSPELMRTSACTAPETEFLFDHLVSAKSGPYDINAPSPASGAKEWIDGGWCERQRCDFLAPPEHQIVGKEDESLRTRAFGVIEGRRGLARPPSPGRNLDPSSLRRLPDGVEDGSVLGKRSAPDYGDTPRAWKGIEQQLQLYRPALPRCR